MEKLSFRAGCQDDANGVAPVCGTIHVRWCILSPMEPLGGCPIPQIATADLATTDRL